MSPRQRRRPGDLRKHIRIQNGMPLESGVEWEKESALQRWMSTLWRKQRSPLHAAAPGTPPALATAGAVPTSPFPQCDTSLAANPRYAGPSPGPQGLCLPLQAAPEDEHPPQPQAKPPAPSSPLPCPPLRQLLANGRETRRGGGEGPFREREAHRRGHVVADPGRPMEGEGTHGGVRGEHETDTMQGLGGPRVGAMPEPVPRSTSSEAPPSNGAPLVARSRTLQGRGRPSAGTGAATVSDAKPRRPGPNQGFSLRAGGPRLDRSRSVNTGSAAAYGAGARGPSAGAGVGLRLAGDHLRPAPGAPVPESPGARAGRPRALQQPARGRSSGWLWVHSWSSAASRARGLGHSQGVPVPGPVPVQEGALGRGMGARAQGERRDGGGGMGLEPKGGVPYPDLVVPTLVGLSSSLTRELPEEDELEEGATALAGMRWCGRGRSFGGAGDTGALSPLSPPAVPLRTATTASSRGAYLWAGKQARGPSPAESAPAPSISSAWRQWRLSRQLTFSQEDVDLMKGFLAHPEAWATLEESPANRFYVFEYLQNVRANQPAILQELRAVVVSSRPRGRRRAEEQLGALRREALQLLALLFSDREGLWRLRRQQLMDLILSSEHWEEGEEQATEEVGQEGESESELAEVPAPGQERTAEEKRSVGAAAAPLAGIEDSKGAPLMADVAPITDVSLMNNVPATTAEGNSMSQETAEGGGNASLSPLSPSPCGEGFRVADTQSGGEEGLDARGEQGSGVRTSGVPEDVGGEGQGARAAASEGATGAGAPAVSASEAYMRLTAAFAARDRELLRAFLVHPGQWDSLLVRTPMHARFLATLREIRQGHGQGQGQAQGQGQEPGQGQGQGEELEGLRGLVRGLGCVQAEDIRGLNLGALQVLALVLGDSPRVSGLSRDELVRICLTCGPWGGDTPPHNTLPRSTPREARGQELAAPLLPRGGGGGRRQVGEAQGFTGGQTRGLGTPAAAVARGSPQHPSLPALAKQLSLSPPSMLSPVTPRTPPNRSLRSVPCDEAPGNGSITAPDNEGGSCAPLQSKGAPALLVHLEEDPGKSLVWERGTSRSSTQGSSNESSIVASRSSSLSSSSSSSGSRSNSSSRRRSNSNSSSNGGKVMPCNEGELCGTDGCTMETGMPAYRSQYALASNSIEHKGQDAASRAGQEGRALARLGAASPGHLDAARPREDAEDVPSSGHSPSSEGEPRAGTGVPTASSWVHPLPLAASRGAAEEGRQEQGTGANGEGSAQDLEGSRGEEAEMDAIGRVEVEALQQVAGEEVGLRQRLQDEEAALERAVRAAHEAQQALALAQQAASTAQARVEEVGRALQRQERLRDAVRAKAAACRAAWQRHVVATQRLALPVAPPSPRFSPKGSLQRQRQQDLEAAAKTHHEYLRLWEELEALPNTPTM